VTDPISPDIIAWLETLPLREQAVTLHAMAMAIPALQRNQRWKARIAAARVALDPTAAQLADILTAARSRAKRLKDELAD
jgi:phosphotransacetylase